MTLASFKRCIVGHLTGGQEKFSLIMGHCDCQGVGGVVVRRDRPWFVILGLSFFVSLTITTGSLGDVPTKRDVQSTDRPLTINRIKRYSKR